MVLPTVNQLLDANYQLTVWNRCAKRLLRWLIEA
jgi:hypothetical protein